MLGNIKSPKIEKQIEGPEDARVPIAREDKPAVNEPEKQSKKTQLQDTAESARAIIHCANDNKVARKRDRTSRAEDIMGMLEREEKRALKK